MHRIDVRILDPRLKDSPPHYATPGSAGLDLRAVDNPYNTYAYGGLPPGPIANPSLASLQAVAQPAQTDFLYYRALCDGSGRHAFAVTFEEHLANACS